MKESTTCRKTYKYKLPPTAEQARVMEAVMWRCRRLYHTAAHLLKDQNIQRQRSVFQHKTALVLLRAYDSLYLDDLPVANMVRNCHLARSISDADLATTTYYSYRQFGIHPACNRAYYSGGLHAW